MTAPAKLNPKPTSKTFALATVITLAAAIAAMAHGLELRFHIENTTDAMIEASIGAKWLTLAIGLVLLAAWTSWKSSGSRLAVIAVASPVAAAISELQYGGNILPYGAALLTVLAAAIGVIAIVILAFRKAPVRL